MIEIIRGLNGPAHLGTGRSVNASQLERWMGKEELARVSEAMKQYYGPPIALGGVPGSVFAHHGGDFRGELRAGFETSARDRLEAFAKRIKRASRIVSRRNGLRMAAGFTSLSDLISEATVGGKRLDYIFNKAGVTGVVNATNTLWYVGAQPAAGANAGAAPGGTQFTDTDSLTFSNPTSGDTQHFVFGAPIASVAPHTLLMYDRLHSTTKTMNATTTEAVTGVPLRYQSTTVTNPDYIAGNQLMVECRTALPATAHNWTVCQYTDQGGNATQSIPSFAGNASNIQYRLDQPAGTWNVPLAAGDTGVKALTQMQCSALVATGAIDFTVFRPLVWMPCPIANLVCSVDGINTAFNLVRIFDDACLAFLEVCKSATTATTYTGTFTTVSG